MPHTIALPEALNVDLNSRGLDLLFANQVDNFVDLADEVSIPSWPEFMLNDVVANEYWFPLNDKFSAFQFALIDNKTKAWVAVGNSIPVSWVGLLDDLPDTGWDWALRTGMESKNIPNLLCALAIQILPKFRGGGLSSLMVKIMKETGHHYGLDQLIAPVRPNKKCDYPLLPTEDYINWRRADERFDPWLRVHERLGAHVIKVCPQAMLISDSIKSWEKWTGLSFQTSGEYVVPGALDTVKIDLKTDRGVYVEPNVWMLHNY